MVKLVQIHQLASKEVPTGQLVQHEQGASAGQDAEARIHSSKPLSNEQNLSTVTKNCNYPHHSSLYSHGKHCDVAFQQSRHRYRNSSLSFHYHGSASNGHAPTGHPIGHENYPLYHREGSRPPKPYDNNYYNTIDAHRVDHRHYASAYYHYRHRLERRHRDIGKHLSPTGRNNAMSSKPNPLYLNKKFEIEQHDRDEKGLPLRSVEADQRSEKMYSKSNGTGQGNCSHTTSLDQENSKNISNALKSPVTMCFERMLGAAKYLAHNPTPDHVKKQLALKNAKSDHKSPLRDAVACLHKRKSDLPENSSTETLPHAKRVRGLKPFLISEEEASKLNQLGDDNPFVQLLNDEVLYHQVILLMTLEADGKDTKKLSESTLPVSTVIGEGFFWRDYPELEKILYDNMQSYYKMSLTSRQSRTQQQFNNHMVYSIRKAATNHGYSFDPGFNDKRLRDRIRCFYKTHLQNAKKRLATMQKHPNNAMNKSQLRIWIAAAEEKMKNNEEKEEGKDVEGNED